MTLGSILKGNILCRRKENIVFSFNFVLHSDKAMVILETVSLYNALYDLFLYYAAT